jgi:nicotinic acetylcholine receptor
MLLDLLLFNSAAESFDPKNDVNAVIQNNGDVSFLPPGMFRSTCQIESMNFP